MQAGGDGDVRGRGGGGLGSDGVLARGKKGGRGRMEEEAGIAQELQQLQLGKGEGG